MCLEPNMSTVVPAGEAVGGEGGVAGRVREEQADPEQENAPP